MADDAVMEILRNIQESIVEQAEKTGASIAALDSKVTRQHAIVTQDMRMVRAAIHDRGETRVTEGEIKALHEDVNRVLQDMADLTMRVELLEGRRQWAVVATG